MDKWTIGQMDQCLRRAASLCTLIVCAVAWSIAAQSTPNFTGIWVTVSPADAAGQEQEVRHTATTLSTGHASEGGGHHASYKLDGSESRNELFFFSSRRRHTRFDCDWSSDVCSSDLFFPAFGVRMAAGRFFDVDEKGPADDVGAVLSYGFWQRRFAGDSAVIGKTIWLAERSEERRVGKEWRCRWLRYP